jgi:hypothetical protein
MHIDQNSVVAGRFVDLDELRGLRSVEAGYLYRAHCGLSFVDATI